jgi:hypothetical protein
MVITEKLHQKHYTEQSEVPLTRNDSSFLVIASEAKQPLYDEISTLSPEEPVILIKEIIID